MGRPQPRGRWRCPPRRASAEPRGGRADAPHAPSLPAMGWDGLERETVGYSTCSFTVCDGIASPLVIRCTREIYVVWCACHSPTMTPALPCWIHSCANAHSPLPTHAGALRPPHLPCPSGLLLENAGAVLGRCRSGPFLLAQLALGLKALALHERLRGAGKNVDVVTIGYASLAGHHLPLKRGRPHLPVVPEPIPPSMYPRLRPPEF